jgi:hypothetical protein
VKSSSTKEIFAVTVNKIKQQNMENNLLQSKFPSKVSSLSSNNDITGQLVEENRIKTLASETTNGTTTTDNHTVKEIWGTSAVTGNCKLFSWNFWKVFC